MARADKGSLLGKGPRSPLLERAGGRSLLVLGLLAALALSALLTIELATPGARGFGGLRPGDVAPVSYKAAADVTLVDRAATEELRHTALETAPVVYDFDERWGAAVRSRVDLAFDFCGFFSFRLFQVIVHTKPQPKTTRSPKVTRES